MDALDVAELGEGLVLHAPEVLDLETLDAETLQEGREDRWVAERRSTRQGQR